MTFVLLLLLQLFTYDQLSTVLVAPNLNATTNQAHGANVYNQCISDPAYTLDADLWFEPWPAQSYRVNVWYANGATDSVDVDSTSSPSGLSATYLGSGEDRVGEGNQASPNGTPDRSIRLQGLKEIPARVQIVGSPSGLWESPFNGANWVIATKYAKPAGVVESCNSRAIGEMVKDCIARFAAYYKELIEGRVRSKSKEAERLKFYKFALWPTS